MARDRQIHERLQNWGNWKVRQMAGPGKFASVNLMDMAPGEREPWMDAPIAPNEEDAWLVDAEVNKLPSELRATAECYYLSTLTEGERCVRLHCSKQTLHDRLERIDRRLLIGLADAAHAKKLRQDEAAAHLRTVQASARP